jgi:hypothetical protein
MIFYYLLNSYKYLSVIQQKLNSSLILPAIQDTLLSKMVHEHDDGLEFPSQEKAQVTTSNDMNQTALPDPVTPEYPSGLRLTFIFVALCLTVFLVALVYTYISTSPQGGPKIACIANKNHNRIKPS